MTQKEFDTYRFSIETQVMYRGEWFFVTGVDWMHNIVRISKGAGIGVRRSEIEDIRQLPIGEKGAL